MPKQSKSMEHQYRCQHQNRVGGNWQMRWKCDIPIKESGKIFKALKVELQRSWIKADLSNSTQFVDQVQAVIGLWHLQNSWGHDSVWTFFMDFHYTQNKFEESICISRANWLILNGLIKNHRIIEGNVVHFQALTSTQTGRLTLQGTVDDGIRYILGQLCYESP